jgi:hypothetical protein
MIMALKIDRVQTSGTSVYSSETTRRYIPEDSHLHTRCRENLQSHWCITSFCEEERRCHCLSRFSFYLDEPEPIVQQLRLFILELASSENTIDSLWWSARDKRRIPGFMHTALETDFISKYFYKINICELQLLLFYITKFYRYLNLTY